MKIRLLPVVLIVIATFAVGLGLGSFLPRAAALSAGDVLAFVGGLIGAAATIGGGVYILDRERRREERERREFLCALLDELEAACEPFQMANEAALIKRRGIKTPEAVRNLKEAIRRVHQFRDRLEPQNIKMLKVSDLISDIHVNEAEVDEMAVVANFYPESADYGGLNAICHQALGPVAKIRKLI